MIRVENLTKTFGDFTALDNLCMHVPEGCVYGLIGPNGAGKTTLIKHIVGVLRQDAGDIAVGGENLYENIACKQNVVYIPDDVFFYKSYTIKDMKTLYKSIYPFFSEERYEKMKAVFGIDENKRVMRLSKGMQKQVAFWLGICTMPKLMVLDEPVDGLDPVMRRRVWNLILQDVAERKTTVLISSHNLRELESVCDYVGILHQGKIVIEKELDDIKSDVHKLQLAFRETFPEKLLEKLSPMHTATFGSVHMVIARGSLEKLQSVVSQYEPLIMDILPLTLEEVFIYELGGMGYAFEDILL